MESPRVPSDAIVSALRKVAENKESSHNGELCFSFTCVYVLLVFLEKLETVRLEQTSIRVRNVHDVSWIIVWVRGVRDRSL